MSSATTNDNDDDEFYDSETEPSLLIDLDDVKRDCVNLDPNETLSQLPEQPIIYAIQLVKCQTTNQNELLSNGRIFLNRDKAMKALKEDPENRRFKTFRNFSDAYSFSYSDEIESGNAPSMSELEMTVELKNSSAALDAEKLPFSAPKKPEINQLRAFIEKDNLDEVKVKLHANPRFLISAGDTCVAVQESFRYNALHVCAKENRFKISELILDTLSNVHYIQRLYKNDTMEQSKRRVHHLLDSYFNMPEKGVKNLFLYHTNKNKDLFLIYF